LLNTILGSLSSGVVVAPSSYESIATVTVGSGGSASISFTSIPSTYTHLQIRGIARSTLAGTTPDNVAFRINGDSGSNYTTHSLRGSNATVTASNFVSLSYAYLPSTSSAAGSLGSVFAAVVLDLLDYRNTNKTKVFRTLSGFNENNTSGPSNIQFQSALWNSTSAVTSIEFTNSANFAEYSQFALYGIKGA
jgi:hypothetical protein